MYLDDIPCSQVRRGARCVAQKLRRAGFLIRPKSVCQLAQRLDFIGKWFDTQKGSVGNIPGLLVGILGLWVLAVIGPSDSLLMSHLLGRSDWALRPNAVVCIPTDLVTATKIKRTTSWICWVHVSTNPKNTHNQS